MEKLIKTIKAIGTAEAKIVDLKTKIKEIDTETASLEAVEGKNILERQSTKLSALETAFDVIETDEAKKALEVEISGVKTSILNLKRIAELAEQRVKYLQQLKKQDDTLVAAISEYKSEKASFEKEFNKVSKDTLKLLAGETIPEEEVQGEAEVEEVVEQVATEEILPPEEVKAEVILSKENDKTSPETTSEEEPQEEEKAEESKNSEKAPHPIIALAKVLRKYEELSGQEGAEKYSSRYSGFYREIEVTTEENNGISAILNGDEIPGLTAEQVEVLKLSLPKEILAKLKRNDIISARKASTEVYSADFLNKFRPAFTYRVIAELGRILLSENSTEEDVAVFFKNNSDRIIKTRFGGQKPEYRAFAVRSAADLEVE